MTIFTVGQSPIICSTMAEMGTLLTLYPDLEPMTPCTVMSGAGGGIEVYRLQSGVWTRTYPDQATIDWLIANSTDIATLQGNVGSINSAISAITSSLSSKADAATVAAALAAKADQTDVNKKPYVYIGGTQANAPKIYAHSVVVSGGNAVFYPTDNGLIGGNPIFSNSNIFVQPILFAVGAPPSFAPYTLSGDRKTLTIPATKAATGVSLLGINLLGANVAANGDTVTVFVIGT